MNKVFASLLLYSFIYMGVSAQWIPYGYTPGLGTYVDMSMPTSSVVYATGSNGLIKSVDGGLNWTGGFSAIPNFLGTSISFRTAQEGVLSGMNYQTNTSQILYTSNGGTNWTLAYDAGSARIGQVVYTPSGTGYSVAGGQVLRSQTGGSSWMVVGTVPTQVGEICFPSDSTGYTVGDSVIYRSTDGGLTWTSVYTVSGSNVYAIFFASDSIGYISCSGRMGVTSDAGLHWSFTCVSPPSTVNHLVAVSADTAFGTYGGTDVLFTCNRGQSWERQYANPYLANAIAFHGGRGIVAGLGGRYCSYTINNGGQSGKPFAYFGYTGSICDSVVHFQNASWAGYQMRWYYNWQIADSSYDFYHSISIGRGYDTISLVVSNAVNSDTATIRLPRITAPYTTNASRFYLWDDTTCTGFPIHISIDTSQLNYTYTFTANGHVAATVQGPNSGMIVPVYVTDSARLVATISSTGTCTTSRDSVVWEVYSPVDHSHSSVADTIVCGNGTVTVRIDNSSPWYRYTLTTSMGYDTTLPGTGSTIYLTARVSYNYYATTDYARITLHDRCGYLIPDTTISLRLRWPSMAFTPSDSMTYTGRTISLINQSHANTYTWYFDSTATHISDTARNTAVTYLTPGDKVITLIGTAHPQCPDDTISRRVLVADSAYGDAVGALCFDGNIDNNTYPSGGLLSYHVDRYGNTYTGGYEYCCFGGAGYNTGVGAYLRKTDKNGNLLWEKNVPYNLKNDYRYSGSYIAAIASDPAGNVYIAGCYGSSIFFQFGSLTVPGPGGGNCTNFFIAKIDANGNDQWMVASQYNTNGEFYIGATDIKYVDDDHIYISLLKSSNTNEGIYMAFPDSIAPHRHQMRGLNVMQITSSGHFVTNTMAQHLEVFRTYSNNRGNVFGIFNPLFNGTYAQARNAVTGPRLYVHDDCTISMVGFFFDTLRFGNITIYGYTPILSAFVANMDPASGTWLSAHTLYGTDLLYPETQTISGDAYVDYMPRFDFDRYKNLYIASHVDSLFFSPFPVFANPGNYAYLHLSSSLILAKFDPQGRNLWYTVSRDYASQHHLTGLHLNHDGSALTLTGYYTYGMNLSSTHSAPALHLSRYVASAYIASVDTGGDVQWIKDMGRATSGVSVALSTQSSSGYIYTLGNYQGYTHAYRYHLSGDCMASDTVAASYKCVSANITILDGSLPVCANDSLTFAAHPDDMTSLRYLWRIDGIPTGDSTSSLHISTPVQGQVVTCTITQADGTSLGTDSSIITLAPMPAPSIFQSHDSLIASVAASYRWYLDSTYLGSTRSISITQNGTYTLVVANTAGCTASQNYTVTNVGIAGLAQDDDIRLYPSPNKGQFTIERAIGTASTMTIEDIYGRMVYTQQLTSASDRIDVRWLPAGTYLVGVRSLPGCRVFQIVKE